MGTRERRERDRDRGHQVALWTTWSEVLRPVLQQDPEVLQGGNSSEEVQGYPP